MGYLLFKKNTTRFVDDLGEYGEKDKEYGSEQAAQKAANIAVVAAVATPKPEPEDYPAGSVVSFAAIEENSEPSMKSMTRTELCKKYGVTFNPRKTKAAIIAEIEAKNAK